MYFPLEIWEHIFLYADPVVLTNLKTVCKDWNEIIAKILKDNDHWHKLCKKEIPNHLWSTLCETLNPKKFYNEFDGKHDAMMWMAMYKLWFKSKNVVQWSTQSKYIEPLLKQSPVESITCMDTSGNLLAVGTSEGYIYFYNISRLYEGSIYTADHMEYVHSVQFIRDETNIVCISCSINNHISFWDVKSKKLIGKTRGELICTSYSYCYTAMHNAIVTEGSIPRTVYEFNTNKIIAVGADNNKVHFYTEEGHFVHLKLDTGKEIYVTWTCVPLPNIKVRRYYIFKPHMAVCITENGYIGFLHDKEWKLHNLFPILHGTPTTVLVYAHLLIVGLNSGNVHVYYIKDFETINFNTMDSKKLTFDTTAVISLNIMVHIEEFLIVSYGTKIYITKFT
ncbi:uncharacterized protein LOC128889891 [Hylaeus anthracinus]|uniref:uncharacterized protein LOC128889891 n=1 Tax=Hylaeus anthracinus TaxID=313031 RepID=UPI0023B970A8|nr:uncharacterized protein LOC128889891 [Hylaeus anthracinus]